MSWVLQKVFEAIKEMFQDKNFPVEIYFEENTVTFTYLGYRYQLTLERIG